ncbi:MAG: hypothetical protein P4L76_12210 [Beijerinckiaceae bacterium]|nr:hypothetical protein [Beijerinckiaceae bacterium]
METVDLIKHGRLLIVLAASAVSGCAVTDNFTPRAVQYNQEAANTKSNSIFLNILRAAHRMPLQFTEYTSAIGQTYVGGSVAGTLPVAVTPSNLSKTFSLNPTISTNAQTNVTVQNLNSQEYYYGLQSPLTQEMFATFLSIGYDPDVMMMLAVSSIKGTQGTKFKEIRNDSSSPQAFKIFYNAAHTLVRAGLAFETAKGKARQIGPPLSEQEAKTALLNYITASGTAAANSGSLPDFSKNKNDTYQFTKSSSSMRVCFRESSLASIVARPRGSVLVTKAGSKGYVIHLATRNDIPVADFDLSVSPDRYCGAKAETVAGKQDEIGVNWGLELRSVEAIYNYLGTMTRAKWQYPDVYEQYKLGADSGAAGYMLFDVQKGLSPNAIITAQLGDIYSITPDPAGEIDKSAQVVSVLTDLWALESSAKTFPATTTISLTAP